MKLNEAIEAAYASMFRITDAADLKDFRKPLLAYRDSCKYIDFTSDLREIVPFKAHTAQVLTKASGKELYQVRRMQKAPGRESFTVPSLRFTASGHIPMLRPPRVDSEQRGPLHTHGLADSLGTTLESLIESNVLRCLRSAAEDGGRVVKADIAVARKAVEEAVAQIDRDCTIICHWNDAHRVSISPRREFEIGDFGTLRPTRCMVEGTMLVVADWPEKVGFARSDIEPEAFVSVQNFCEVVPAVACSYGFCVWGDAPVISLDFRQAP